MIGANPSLLKTEINAELIFLDSDMEIFLLFKTVKLAQGVALVS